jgi:hypothetical protein
MEGVCTPYLDFFGLGNGRDSDEASFSVGIFGCFCVCVIAWDFGLQREVAKGVRWSVWITTIACRNKWALPLVSDSVSIGNTGRILVQSKF